MDDNNTPEINYEVLYTQALASIEELTAERDSLTNENTELRAARDSALAENAKTKEVNYTLSRQLNLQQEAAKAPEELLANLFLKKGV